MSDFTQEKAKDENKKKGSAKVLTVLAYLLIIFDLVAIAPVVCPPIFGYHTYTLASDTSGLIAKGSVVYAKEATYAAGDLVAIDNLDGDRDVDVAYISSVSDSEALLENGSTVALTQIEGSVHAKTPFMGYICGLCFSVIGIIALVVIFVVGFVLMMISNKKAKKYNQDKKNEKAN